RARPNREHALRAEPLELAPVVREDAADTRDRQGQQPSTRVDSLAEPRDRDAERHLLELFALDVGDEQPRRVRPEVDRRDSRHLRGTNAVTAATASRASWTAARSTASRASEAWRRAT